MTLSLPSTCEERTGYFQLQLGMKFWPEVVSCLCWVPSESMDQIWALPPTVRSKTMWRLSGDQEGKSLLPDSCVSCSQRFVEMSIT